FDKLIRARFVMSHKLAQRSLQVEFLFSLLGGSFFDYTEDQSLKDQLAGILSALPSLDAVAVRKALARGFHEKELPETLQHKVTGWIEAFLKFVAQHPVTGSAEPDCVISPH